MTAFSGLSAACRSLWAKSGDEAGHGLLAHMLDVAAVATAILEREAPINRNWIAREFGLPNNSAVAWIALLVGLHDFGKAIAGFQGKWPEGQLRDEAAGLPFPARILSASDHAAASAALLRKLLDDTRADPNWVRSVLQAISAHHGHHYLRPEIECARPAHEPAAWGDTRRELFAAYWRTIAPTGHPECEEIALPAVAWLAGLTSVADWIGSNVAWFPLGERADDLTGHFDAARRLAEHALDAIGWPRFWALLEGTDDTDHLIRRIIAADSDLRASREQESRPV